jgi:phage-related protein
MKKHSSGAEADRQPRPIRWVGESKRDLSAFPQEVKTRVGGALWDAQIGLKSPAAKPLKGFGGAGVLEVVVDFDGNALRTVYTVRFAEVVYVLHAFQKKSRQGISTPKGELDVIRLRLARAREDYELWRKSHPSA